MNPEELEQKLDSLLDEARLIIESSNPDAMDVDEMDLRLTSYMSNATEVHRKYEWHANRWKDKVKSMQEVIRSLRRIHETLNIERRNL